MSKPSVKVKSTQKIVDSGVVQFQKRLLLGTPSTGNVRMEWAAARYGMVTPANWSRVDMVQYVNGLIPMRYSVADAQNIIVQEAVSENYEWLLLVEHDTMPPPDALIRFNEYMRRDKYPVVSGLYFTRSQPAEPMIYRGRGNSYHTDWKLGDVVMADGVPTGMLLIKVQLLKDMWEKSPEYSVGNGTVRRVFNTPVNSWFNEDTNAQEAYIGTSDLEFCARVVEEGYLKKDYPKLAKEKYPFVVDTNIACMHINPDGTQFPMGGIKNWCAQNGNL